jgi:hypothetical protein
MVERTLEERVARLEQRLDDLAGARPPRFKYRPKIGGARWACFAVIRS